MLTQFSSRLFGFLLGTTLAAATAYYYVIDEYRLANDMLTEDIYVREPLSYPQATLCQTRHLPALLMVYPP